MPIKHVNFAQQQRVEAADMNAIGDLELGNLAIAIAGFFGPGTSKVARGGRVHQTTPASKNVEIEPLAGFGPFGLPILLEALSTKAIADNASGNPRIDLVSIGVAAVDGDNASRKFWNPSSEASFDQNTNTRTTLVVTVTVTQGTPAATPSAPATPAGHIPLAHVAVANGMTSITDANITPVGGSYVEPVKSLTWEWGGAYGGGTPVALPYQTPDLLTVNIPANRTAVALATAALLFDTVSTDPVAFRVSLETFDGAVSTEIGSSLVFVDTDYGSHFDTVNVMGVLPGGGGALTLRLRVAHYIGGPAIPAVHLSPVIAPVKNRLVVLTP